MSGQLIFSLIGDSNVKRHMNPMNCRDRPPMQEAQLLVCTRREVFQQSLRSIRAETNVVVLSCITNFLTSSEDTSSTLAFRIDPVLTDFFSTIESCCQLHPSRRYLVCPPMYRQVPLWYRDDLAGVLSRFSAASKKVTSSNFGLMPSYSTPSFEADGVHLTAYSGLEFVLHLFDSARALITALSAPDAERESAANASTRLLEDRVVALEQDHRRLNTVVELKTAIDSELEDFRANERMEDCVVVSGLSAISGKLSGKEWFERAKADSQTVLELVVGRQVEVLSVRNSTGMAPGAPVTYTVQVSSTASALAIRSKFGTFFAGGKDNRPPSLSGISVQNSVTKATRIRISILKLLAKRYEASNPGGKARVIGYQPRPLLKLFPPAASKDKRVRSLNYVEAVQKLPTHFTEAEVESITRRAYASFPNQLRSLFIVLSDDFPGLGSRPRNKRAASPSSAASSDRRQRVVDEFEPESNQ